MKKLLPLLKKLKNLEFKKWWKFVFGGVTGLLVLFSLYHLYFAKRIIPGVYMGSTSLGGLTYDKALEVLHSAYEGSSTLVLKSEDSVFEIPLSDIGFEVEWENSIARAFEVGRTGNIFIDTKDKLAGLIKPLKVAVFYDFDDYTLSQQLASIRAEVSTSAEEAFFTVDTGSLEISPSKVGMAIDTGTLHGLVIASLGQFKFDGLELPLKEDKPKISSEALEEVKPEIEYIVFTPLTLSYGDKVWQLSSEEKLSLIEIFKNGENLDVRLNKAHFEAFLRTLGAQINRSPKGKVVTLAGDRVLEFEIIEKGVKLDEKTFTEKFKNVLFLAEKDLAIPVVATGAPDEAAHYGIFALLGEGISYFYGSAPSRIHNLTLAAGRTRGVLVPPGEIYSLNDSVGEISAITGYDTAWIIANGKTILGEGGGVCQTSTTLFRAILNAGLPVVERNPHAYRVSYYEYKSPIGYDASIYQPSLDLKFKNDTPNYVLVESSWDLAKSMLVFRLYGTPDGRTVELSDPVVTNVSPPPADKYVDDPTLSKGTVKQIDFAAWGANVSFTRVVKRGGEVLYEDTFSSNYQPWQAVFLRGTKE